MASIHVISTDTEFSQRVCAASTGLGHTCLPHPSPEAAIQAIANAACDLVVLDVDRTADPALTIDYLANTRGGPSIVAVSSDETPQAFEQAKRAGACEVIHPMASIEEIEQTIGRCLTHRRSRETNAAAPTPGECLCIPITLDATHADELLPLRTVRELAMQEIEAAYLRHIIAMAQGNFQRVQTTAGISRARLYDLLNKHGLRINTE